MDGADIGQLLHNAILGRGDERLSAEQQLEAVAQSNYPGYMQYLTNVFASAPQGTQGEGRNLAGLMLKNQLAARDPRTQYLNQARYKQQLDDSIRNHMKQVSLNALASEEPGIANAAAQLIAAIADIELPDNSWPDLMSHLIQNTSESQPSHLKRASLKAIGYICENANPTNEGVLSKSTEILIAIVQGARSEEKDDEVRLTALNALTNSLEFIRNNFYVEDERNYIMQVVCEATQAENQEIQTAAFGVLGRIVNSYYSLMKPYMEKALYGVTITGMRSSNESVACMAVEFWSTVCDEEYELDLELEDARENGDTNAEDRSFHFATQAAPTVLETLLSLLTRQIDDDGSDDDWSVAMAAGACVQLFAQAARDRVIEPVIMFVSSHLTSENWNEREAAAMAFGSILDGPDPALLKGYIHQALPSLLGLMKDPSPQVKDTDAWCLGRIAELSFDAIDPSRLGDIVTALADGLADGSKVSTNCCWALMNISEQIGTMDGPDSQTSALSQYYPVLVPRLLAASYRSDNEDSCRTSAYEALSTLVIYSANDCLSVITTLSAEVINRLKQTLEYQSQVVSVDDRNNLEELQVNLLGLLTNIIRRVDNNDVKAGADSLMELLLNLLQTKFPNSLTEEDVFIAIGALANSVDSDFERYMTAFIPFLVSALRDPSSQTCNTAIGLVGDISHSLGKGMLPYAEGFMETLFIALRQPDLRRDIRPLILSCIGDIASVIGVEFAKYLPDTMALLAEAAGATEPPASSLEFQEYILSLRESVLDAYVGITAGMREAPQVLHSYLSQIFKFLSLIPQLPSLAKNDTFVRLGVGLLGDIAEMYPNHGVRELCSEPWVIQWVGSITGPVFSQGTKTVAQWTRDNVKRQIS